MPLRHSKKEENLKLVLELLNEREVIEADNSRLLDRFKKTTIRYEIFIIIFSTLNWYSKNTCYFLKRTINIDFHRKLYDVDESKEITADTKILEHEAFEAGIFFSLFFIWKNKLELLPD